MAYQESIDMLKALHLRNEASMGDIPVSIRTQIREVVNATMKDLKFAQEQERLLVIAQDDKRRSLAQEIAQTLRVRGYWVPEDVMSADLISAVGQAVSMLKDLAEKITGGEIPTDTKPKDIVDAIMYCIDTADSDSRELKKRDSVVWTEGMLEFIRRAMQCRTHITEGYEGNPDLKALVDLGVFEVIGNDMYHLRNAGYGEQRDA
jgi:hypothetical protein